jgi:hypothetical protein
MHLTSHVIMQLALGLTIGATTSACQKSRKTIDKVSESEACEDSSVPLPVPRFEAEVAHDESPNVVTVEDLVPEPEPVGTIGFEGDNCPFCGMG